MQRKENNTRQFLLLSIFNVYYIGDYYWHNTKLEPHHSIQFENNFCLKTVNALRNLISLSM